jgi:hypothetical protein
MRGRARDQKIKWFFCERFPAGKSRRQRRAEEFRAEAETRLVDTEASYLKAATCKIELEAEKVAGEIALQQLQEKQLARQTSREEAEARGFEFGTFRDKALLIVFLLLIIFILALAIVDPVLLRSIGDTLPWAPK